MAARRAGGRGDGTELSREVLADAAARVLERDGLDGMSMRKVAAELGVQAPSLYWHVRNKEELLDLTADALFRDLDLDLPDGDWRAQVTLLANRYRTFLKSRRDAVRLLGGRFVVGPYASRATERSLRILLAAGFRRGDAVHAMYLISVVYVQGFVLQESVPMSASEALGATPHEAMAVVANGLASLPPAEYPALTSNVDLMTMMNLDDRFAFGLGCILDGLALRLTGAAPADGCRL